MNEVYIGTKIVLAEPMDAATFNEKVRSLSYPLYDVVEGEAVGKPGYKVVYEDGYTSWSPKDVFERAYRKVTDLERSLVTVSR